MCKKLKKRITVTWTAKKKTNESVLKEADTESILLDRIRTPHAKLFGHAAVWITYLRLERLTEREPEVGRKKVCGTS